MRGQAMIPISDSVPTRRVPWVNLSLLLVTLLVFLFEVALGPARDQLIVRWGAVPSLVLAALSGDPRVPPQALATLITSQFLHGGWLHVGANMLFLWVFGRAVEDRLGHLRYLLFYLLWGAGAALVQIWVTGPSAVPLIGASGAIAGVLGAYFVLYPTAWVSLLVPILFFFWVIDVPAILALAYWFATQFLSGLGAITHGSSATGGVAFFAHLGGFGLGALTAPFFRAQKGAGGRSSGVRAAQPWAPAVPVLQVLSVAADVLVLVLLLRTGLRLLDLGQRGPWSWLARLIFDWSWPLVEPFAELLPALAVLDGRVLELYTLLAVLVYSTITSLLIWLLGLGMRRPASAR